ncbi:MarR family winged helix-turn-helix transcriptional regulator [Rhizobium sp. SSA_523]|uniref:MarR family winged helix-turn-helix transcriptional regulator n=1 Tax=Rhizobium sp. SSA_523 TaxID=2952477 RepID=UPI002090D6AD|nr:MarR family transcriptional regulator [Rhizobium sp. SSA_523]MCO5731840.1 MarR family transcriptional regulator [Rhizobium sp. SSA_523]WKC22796.1 MarR family transcriptional regulator [Rhizobium sp. SSA_523]
MSKKKGDKKDKTGKKKDPASLAELAPALTQAARSLRTSLSRNLAEAGLYAGQDGVILLLEAEPGLTPGQLAQRLGVKAPTMTRTIGRMEAQGFLERRSDGTDARLTKIHLSETGRQSVDRIHQAVATCSQQAIEGFSDKELRSIIKLLKAVDRNLHGLVPETDAEEE